MTKKPVSKAFLDSLDYADRGLGNGLGHGENAIDREAEYIPGIGMRLKSKANPSSPSTVARLTAEVKKNGLENLINHNASS